jgi:V/A-type H+/Na+-transporting ATPase subunit A
MSTLRRVNGALVEIDVTDRLAMAELVEVGADRLPAEIVALRSGSATAQVYEYTGGLCPGAAVTALGRPLSVRLGPGLTGHAFDGLLRPLDGPRAWLRPDAEDDHDDDRPWAFEPSARAGDTVHSGQKLGIVAGAGPVQHRVLVPPAVQGRLDMLCPAGQYRADEPVAVVAGVPVRLADWWPIRRPRPYRERSSSATPLQTGQRVLDALYPVTKGGTAAVPGGFGTGKTMLLQQIAKWCDADVIVYVGCGERGNELADVITDLADLADPRTGGRLADRTVLIANTSNMPIMAREASIHTGVTVAEYFRDMGYHVVVIADSTSRWAEALREFASRTGALPAEEGYPAGLASALAAFYERAGWVETLAGDEGSVTVVGAVSPPGGDMTEPVTTYTQRLVRTLWTLDRTLAYSRHYPAVSWSGSYCRDVDAIGAWYAGHGDPQWSARRARMMALLAEADRLAALAELVGVAALPGSERMTLLGGRLLREAVLQQNSLSPNDAYCTLAKTSAIIESVFDVMSRCRELIATVDPADIESADFAPLLRAGAETAPDDVDGVRRRAAQVLQSWPGRA